MRSINQLIQHMNKEAGDPNVKREFDAFKQLDDNIIELQNKIANLEKKNMRYFCRAYLDGAIPITLNTGSPIPFNKTIYPQFGNMHDDVVDNDRIRIRRDGVYHLSGGCWFDVSNVGTRRQININSDRSGALVIQRLSNNPGEKVIVNAAGSYYLYKDDIIRLYIDIGLGAISIDVLPGQITFLAVSERMEDLDPSQYGLMTPERNMR